MWTFFIIAFQVSFFFLILPWFFFSHLCNQLIASAFLSFILLIFQAMVIVAWKRSGSVYTVFDGGFLRRLLSIYITYAVLNLFEGKWRQSHIDVHNHIYNHIYDNGSCYSYYLYYFSIQCYLQILYYNFWNQLMPYFSDRLLIGWVWWFFIFVFVPSAAILDIALTFNAWRSFEFNQIIRYLMKLFTGAIWVVALPIGYAISVKNPTGVIKFLKDWTGNMQNQSFYNYLVVLYLIPDLLATILFAVPLLRKKVELSNWRIIILVMWWNQASIINIINFELLFIWSCLFFQLCAILLLFPFHLCYIIICLYFLFCSSLNFMWEEACMRTYFHSLSKRKYLFLVEPYLSFVTYAWIWTCSIKRIIWYTGTQCFGLCC